jgi:hypothetical protein
MSRLYERFLVWLAWRLPRDLAYWMTIRVGTEGFDGPYPLNPAERTIGEALDDWRK